MTGYTLAETKKAVIAGLIAGLAVLGYFIQFDPGFDKAAIAVTVGVFNVVGVFAAKNHTADDVQKAVSALTASALAIVAYFATVNPDQTESWIAIVGAVVNVYGVYIVRNAKAPRTWNGQRARSG